MDIQTISGLGPKTKQKLEHLGIHTIKDLLYHFPSRYLDFSKISKISELQLNDTATIRVQVLSFINLKTRRGMSMQKLVVADETGRLSIIFFNQNYLQSSLKIGEKYSFAGRVGIFSKSLTLQNPEYGDLHTGKIVPVYPQTAGVSTKLIRKIVTSALLKNDLLDFPENILNKYSIQPIRTSLNQIHFPKSNPELEQAQTNLALREIIDLQLQSYKIKEDWKKQKLTKQIAFDQKSEDIFRKKLPFKLTSSQEKAWLEIKDDIFSKRPTNRLLQGDVGSGKTILAMLSCIQSLKNKTTSIVIVPTEVLAQQHYQNFSKYIDKKDIVLITGSNKNKFEENKIIITTHAIFFKKELSLDTISIVIIDEQHKFGVSQRSFFEHKNKVPHILTMTATPIPRTVNLTLLGHLDVSVLDAPPSGRLPIVTKIINEKRLTDCLSWIHKEYVQNKTQAFIVAPLIEMSESLEGVVSVSDLEEKVKNILKQAKVGLLHGKLKPKDKEQIMSDFKENKTSILVSTPVIEVGVDIPNATSIIIFSPERFGLAQLHQLRGRVGRGDKQSYCFLVANRPSARLNMFTNTKDGNKLALFDLSNRGAGDIFGTLQHGFSNLKLANTSDIELINKAQKVLKDLLKIKFFNTKQEKSLRVALN